MSRAVSNAPRASLQLWALQHQGRPVDFRWHWPAASRKVGFDEILSGLHGVAPDLLAQAHACSLQSVGPVEQPVWILGNSSHELVCSVNQQMLTAGSQLRLDHGDAIELGLTRLVVSLDASQALPDLPLDPPPEQAPAENAAPFDLTDLDTPAERSPLAQDERYGPSRADFGDLIALTDEPLVSAAAPQAQFGSGAERPQPEQAAEHDPLQVLHTQYLARLRNPVHGDDQDLWSDIVRGDSSWHADPMQQWMQAAGPGASLDDLLGQSHSIDSVLQGLDALGATDVLEPEPFDSVMHLFAPEHLRERVPDSLLALVQRSLPGLTRREHHSLSLDSVMPFTGGEDPVEIK